MLATKELNDCDSQDWESMMEELSYRDEREYELEQDIDSIMDEEVIEAVERNNK